MVTVAVAECLPKSCVWLCSNSHPKTIFPVVDYLEGGANKKNTFCIILFFAPPGSSIGSQTATLPSENI